MPRRRPHYSVTLAVLTFAGSAFALQQTMVFPALPTFARELGASTAWATWVLTGFLVSAAVTTPLIGKLGDQYGKERMLVASLAIFLAGCVGAAFAWDIWSLIAFRALPGAGGAVFPLSFGIIRDEFPPEKVKLGIGLVSAVFGIGGGVGIVLSGVVVDNLSWRWLFIIGAVGVAAAIGLVHRFVPESPVRSPSRLDVPGALLLSAGLVAVMLALTEGEAWGWTSAPILGLAGAAAALLVAWVLVELRVGEPMVDMRMFSHRPVLLTNATTMVAGFALFGCFVLIPSFVEAPARLGYGFGATATEAGFYLLPASIAQLVSGPGGGLLGRRYGSQWPLAGGMLAVAVAALVLSAWHDEPWQIVAASFALGLGVGLAFAAMVALISDSVDATEMGIATGMNTVVRVIGAVVGGQVGAALLTARTIPGSSLPAESAFAVAFGLSAVAALVAATVALFIRPSAAPRPRLEPAEALD